MESLRGRERPPEAQVPHPQEEGARASLAELLERSKAGIERESAFVGGEG